MPFERPKELLKPVKRRFIFLTFVIAVLVELIPLPAGSTRWLPDLIGLLLLYWVINQPRRVNIGSAFLLGLVADAATAGLFGQHALAYSITSYLALRQQRQLVMFNLGQQALAVLALMLANQTIMVVARMITGAAFVGWSYFLPPLVGALLWPLLTKLLLLPYRQHSV
ncbi:rod shape-determining protein MreD [Pseudogulbenkiania sp. NH8B]|uniref:Rod shape-determining protein MreD n=1 Tax=Pseudogulbenkiania subflava DSM 22618 TaxID=1123014 RepID=A0A1Y6B5K9_9NEIS|nr:MULTISPECIES: rod shape-determining protein MreD [Pseudogulbenkiania]BAK75006.1 rod shape-determining protein MreD [Pseudogulbenkiania sp. NH8B]SME93431.1 rod shape-determining protein MreD [Pseudogulbenkiania subflava DSM 22618]